MKQVHEHQDPQRYPRVIDPIEKEMIDLHTKGMKSIIVDITKVLVKQKKDVQPK